MVANAFGICQFTICILLNLPSFVKIMCICIMCICICICMCICILLNLAAFVKIMCIPFATDCSRNRRKSGRPKLTLSELQKKFTVWEKKEIHKKREKEIHNKREKKKFTIRESWRRWMYITLLYSNILTHIYNLLHFCDIFCVCGGTASPLLGFVRLKLDKAI